MLRRLVLATPLLGMLPFDAAAQQPAAAQQTPQAFLQSVYDPYLKANFKGQPYNDTGRFFSPDLARAMERDVRGAKQHNEVPTLDGDPFVDAQEWKVTDLVVRVSGTGDAATGVVTFANFGKPKRLAVSLLRTPAGWRISDIAGANGSLRTLFKLRQ
ncbi:MAG: DUF3828 domain-containing protein [Alphaproteobacteria bacterium]|nr:DUF3828 domain-containing protein [Alphaproteobacteria bacterium]